MGPATAAKQERTDSSELTSRVRNSTGRPSRPAVSASPGEAAGLRMVAMTVCPARASSSAVASPMPELVPVISTVAMCDPFPSGLRCAGEYHNAAYATPRRLASRLPADGMLASSYVARSQFT